MKVTARSRRDNPVLSWAGLWFQTLRMMVLSHSGESLPTPSSSISVPTGFASRRWLHISGVTESARNNPEIVMALRIGTWSESRLATP